LQVGVTPTAKRIVLGAIEGLVSLVGVTPTCKHVTLRAITKLVSNSVNARSHRGTGLTQKFLEKKEEKKKKKKTKKRPKKAPRKGLGTN